MKKDIYMEFYNNYLQNQRNYRDDFFPNETIDKANSYLILDNNKYNRMLSNEELQVIAIDAFELLLFWIQIGEVEIEHFERFMSILVSYSNKIFEPLDKEITTAMIEMMQLIEFEEHVIQTTIELHIEVPDLLRYTFNAEH